MAATDTRQKPARKHKARVAKTHKATMISKLQKLNTALGTLLAPRYATIGETFITCIRATQENIVTAGLEVDKLDDAWAPAIKRFRKMTPECLKKMREQAKKLAVRIAEAEAAS